MRVIIKTGDAFVSIVIFRIRVKLPLNKSKKRLANGNTASSTTERQYFPIGFERRRVRGLALRV